MIKKILYWFFFGITQSCIIGLVWNGVHGHDIQFNVYKFVAWLSTIMCLFIGFAKAVNPDAMNKAIPNRKTPSWATFGSDLVIALILAGFGHFFYAGLKMVEQFAEQFILDKESGYKQSPPQGN